MDLRDLLRAERETERQFVAAALAAESQPEGWPASLIFFHISRWRGRLRRALTDEREGRGHAPLAVDIDALNDAELAQGAGVSLDEAAAAADEELRALIGLAEADRPFAWGPATTVAEALIRNSYIHPRNHMAAYLRENGDRPAADRMFEEAATELRALGAPPFSLGAALFNLAAVRVAQGRHDEALGLLEEAAPMRPDLSQAASSDAELAPLKGDPRFQELTARA